MNHGIRRNSSLCVCKLGNNFKSLSGKLIVNRRNSLWSSRVSLYSHQYWLSTALFSFICSAYVCMYVHLYEWERLLYSLQYNLLLLLNWFLSFSSFGTDISHFKKVKKYCHKNRDYGWKALLSYHSLVF